MKNIIQEMRDRLDLIEEDAQFDQELMEELELMFEASPLINTFGRDEQGVRLAKYLHKTYKVSDQAVLVPFTHPTGNLDLETFKGHYDNFMILKGPNGWAAFKPQEEYLQRMLQMPGYNPAKDRTIKYTGIFSLKDGQGIQEKEIVGTRGGAYNKKEKKEVTKATIADQLKHFIGEKPISVYRLMERDPEEVEKLPASQLMGRRSGDMPTKASVQRRKIDVRAAMKDKDDIHSAINRISARLGRIKDKVLKQVKIRRIRAGDKNNLIIKNWEQQPDQYSASWFEAVEQAVTSDEFLNAVKADVDQYRQETGDKSSDELVAARLAAKGSSKVLSPLLKAVRTQLEAKANR
jgi:hypothetical protein